MTDNTPSVYWNRILIVVILTFASVADLAAPLITGDGFLAIIKIFMMLGIAFALQSAFKWIRILLLVVGGGALVLNLAVFVLRIDSQWWYSFFVYKIAVSAALPLYVSLLIISLLGYLFLRHYDMSK